MDRRVRQLTYDYVVRGKPCVVRCRQPERVTYVACQEHHLKGDDAAVRAPLAEVVAPEGPRPKGLLRVVKGAGI